MSDQVCKGLVSHGDTASGPEGKSLAGHGGAHLALRRQRQVEISEFKASLIYIANSRPTRDTQ